MSFEDFAHFSTGYMINMNSSKEYFLFVIPPKMFVKVPRKYIL